MAKIQRIQKSRKEQKCRRCGKIIPVGSSYLKCEIGFGPTIVRCVGCGLEQWECTTSEYQLNVGELQNRWHENYDVSNEGCVEEIRDAVQAIYDEEDEKYGNLPENLQYAPVGELIQARMDACDAAMSELDSIDVEGLKDEALGEILDFDDDDDVDHDYDTILEQLEQSDPSTAEELRSKLEELLADAIQAALDNLDS